MLQAELEHDRTKTYLVEISPLGLVEMTRQNVTAGVREILTRICPTCGGEGVVLSEQTMAVEAERRLRKLARASGSEAYLVRLNAKVASGLVGPGGTKLIELENETGKRFTLEPVERMPLSEVDVILEGTRAEVNGSAVPVADNDEITVRISEPHMYNVTDGVARLDGGYPVVVGGAIGYIGQQHKVRIDRATRTTAYATLLDAKPTAMDTPPEPDDYELPEFEREVGERLELEDRRPRSRRKTPAKPRAAATATATATAEKDADVTDETAAAPKPRRRSRAKPAAEKATAEAAVEQPATDDGAADATQNGDADVVDAAAEGGEEATANRRRRRGKRGGRGRSKAAAADGDGAAADVDEPAATRPPGDGDGAAPEEAPSAAPRPRRRAPARRAAASATAASDAEGDQAPAAPPPPPTTPAPTPELRARARAAERRRAARE